MRWRQLESKQNTSNGTKSSERGFQPPARFVRHLYLLFDYFLLLWFELCCGAWTRDSSWLPFTFYTLVNFEQVDHFVLVIFVSRVLFCSIVLFNYKRTFNKIVLFLIAMLLNELRGIPCLNESFNYSNHRSHSLSVEKNVFKDLQNLLNNEQNL